LQNKKCAHNLTKGFLVMPKGEQMAWWFVGVTRSHPWFFFNNFASQEDWQQSTRGLCQIWLEARECFSNPSIYKNPWSKLFFP
jgi:hypothetical protein